MGSMREVVRDGALGELRSLYWCLGGSWGFGGEGDEEFLIEKGVF